MDEIYKDEQFCNLLMEIRQVSQFVAHIEMNYTSQKYFWLILKFSFLL